MVKALMSGRKCWFRVAAIGTAGQGAWSEAVGVVRGEGESVRPVSSPLLQSLPHLLNDYHRGVLRVLSVAVRD